LDSSHNFIEGDSSNTRDDLYMTGDASTLHLDKFEEWYDMSTDDIGDYNMDLMAERAAIRFNQTVAKDPNFYYGPFTGLVARNAGYVFPGRLFANHTADAPLEGVLSRPHYIPSYVQSLADFQKPRIFSSPSMPSLVRREISLTIKGGSQFRRTGTSDR
jgi:hypothetical protein